MAGKVDLQYRDYTGETSTVGVYCTSLTAGNWTAQETLRLAFIAALEAIVNGIPSKETVIASATVLSAAKPTDPFAQRETKWLLDYHDTTTNKGYQVEVPTANLNLLAENLDTMPLTTGVGADLKTAFEAFVKSPTGGAVVLDKVTHVGRNI